MKQNIQILQQAVKITQDQIAVQKRQIFNSKTQKILFQILKQGKNQNRQQSHLNTNATFQQEDFSQQYTKKTSPYDTKRFKSQQPYYKNQNLQNTLQKTDLYVSGFPKQYFPQKINCFNKNCLKELLTQKSSLVFSSNEFDVFSKYTLRQDQLCSLIAQIRVQKKCIMNLTDVFVIIYDSQRTNVQLRYQKIYYHMLKGYANFQFCVQLSKQNIQEFGFYIQISYKTDFISNKITNFKVPIPISLLIKPQIINQQKFIQVWKIIKNQQYIKTKILDVSYIKSYEDLNAILPFLYISEDNDPYISYGILFRYIQSSTFFLLKLKCSINGKISVHLKSEQNANNQIKKKILDIINFLLFPQ